MKRNQIMSVIKALADTMGFYRCLLATFISMDEGTYNQTMNILESKNFKDSTALATFFEC